MKLPKSVISGQRPTALTMSSYHWVATVPENAFADQWVQELVLGAVQVDLDMPQAVLDLIWIRQEVTVISYLLAFCSKFQCFWSVIGN